MKGGSLQGLMVKFLVLCSRSVRHVIPVRNTAHIRNVLPCGFRSPRFHLVSTLKHGLQVSLMKVTLSGLSPVSLSQPGAHDDQGLSTA
jgi:hypothetical protein